MEDKNKTGFSAPVYGIILPNGARIRRLPDGKIELIEPKKKNSNPKRNVKGE